MYLLFVIATKSNKKVKAVRWGIVLMEEDFRELPSERGYLPEAFASYYTPFLEALYFSLNALFSTRRGLLVK